MKTFFPHITTCSYFSGLYRPTPYLVQTLDQNSAQISFAALFRQTVVMLALVLSFNRSAQAQFLTGEFNTGDTIEIATIRTEKIISEAASYFVQKRTDQPLSSINGIEFISREDFLPWRVLPARMVDDDIYIRFTVRNNADTAENIFFNPGLFYQDIFIYEVLPDSSLREQTDSSIQTHAKSFEEGFRKITVPPQGAYDYVVLLRAVRTSINSLEPKLVASYYVPILITLLRQQSGDLNMFGYLFSGLLLLMVLYSLTNYLQTFTPEFLSYAMYTFLMGLLMYLKTYFYNYSHPFNYFFEGYLDFVLQCLGILCYTMFVNQFLQTKKKYPLLYNFMTGGQILIVTSLILYSFVHFFQRDFLLEYNIENGVKYLLLGLGIFFILYGLGVKDRLMRYLIWGNIALITLSAFSLAMIVGPIHIPGAPRVLNQSLFYYELGLVIELICFLAGLSYKNREELIQRTREKEKLRMENERIELEKQIAVYIAQQEERNRISTDMHDELGGGMTAIRLLSELAKNKMRANPLPEIEKISASADDLLNKMNAIIWSMNSSHDTLENLVAYIRSYSLEYFDSTEIHCNITVPHSIPSYEISGERRRNVFLCVKESLNNILKHAQCSRVDMELKLEGNELQISIRDNGVGIDMEKLRQFGNGLVNMKRRMNSINGQFEIGRDQKTGCGTLTRLTLPL